MSLFPVVRDGAYVHVAMGSLVDAPSIRPSDHIFVGSKAPWFDITDAFVHDRVTGRTILASVSSSGTQGNDSSAPAAISADDRLLAFSSYASNLVPRDANATVDAFLRGIGS